jgi:DNA-binding MarR family transcriptional regulator
MHHIVDDPEGAIAEVERALMAIRRSQGRRALGGRTMATVEEALGERVGIGLLGVIDAVEDEPAGGEVTVGLVAERLGLDPSRASRLVAEAVDRGLVERQASQQDGRRSRLAPTARGQRAFDEMQAVRRALVAERMADWSPHERRTFARLMHRFVTPSSAPRSTSTSG